MSALPAALKVLARELLAWDVGRIEAAVARGVLDLGDYRERQALAAVCIDADVDLWPHEVRRLFRALLEVNGTPKRSREIGIGPRRPVVKRLTPDERAVYRAFAEALGVLDRLRATEPDGEWPARVTRGGS